VERLRLIKDDEEIARLRAAAAGLTPVAEAAFAAVRPGVAEKEVAASSKRPCARVDSSARRSIRSWRRAEFRAAALSRRRANIG
jgi:hypothetical protein